MKTASDRQCASKFSFAMQQKIRNIECDQNIILRNKLPQPYMIVAASTKLLQLHKN